LLGVSVCCRAAPRVGDGAVDRVDQEERAMGRVRTAAKAIIVQEGRILLNHCRDESGDWYALPGGGQEEGEPLDETVVRECREEIGAEVEVIGLRYVRDFIVANHDFSYLDEAAHQVEHLFECRVPDGYQPRCGPGADRTQVGVAWLDAASLAAVRVYPEKIRDLLDPRDRGLLPIYWGDVG
jgi:ADP-ribose pyrophosphatase YjhB (NUDIX family)